MEREELARRRNEVKEKKGGEEEDKKMEMKEDVNSNKKMRSRTKRR